MMKYLWGRENALLWLLVAVVIVRGLIYIAVFPPWFAPDESTHFEAIRLLGQERLWPTEDVYFDTPMHPDMPRTFEQFRLWQISQLSSPVGFLNHAYPYVHYYPLHNGGSVILADEYSLIYHVMLAPIGAAIAPLDLVTQLYILRLTSLLFTVLTILVGWLLVRMLFPASPQVAVGTLAFVIFLPMFMHINTAVNVDVFATLIVSIIFLLLTWLFCREASRWLLALILVLTLFAALIKPTTLFVLPTLAAATCIYLARRYRWHWAWQAVAVIGVFVVAAVGGFYVFRYAEGGRGLLTLSLVAEAGPIQTYPVPLTSVFYNSFYSFWGMFGWANVRIPPHWVLALMGACAILVLSTLIFIVRQFTSQSTLEPPQRDILLILSFATVFAVMSLHMPYLATGLPLWSIPQSRYFFPAILPTALLLFLGYQQLVPHRLARFALPIWIAALVGFDAVLLGAVVLPGIYG